MDVTKLQSNMVQIPMPTPKYIINFHAEFHLLSYRNRQCSGISNAKYLVLLSWGYFLAIPQKNKANIKCKAKDMRVLLGNEYGKAATQS